MLAASASAATDLYKAAGEASFVLLGIWWLVVEFRHSEWMRDKWKRRGAYGVSLHFLLPGVMSLMALAAANHSAIWRISFFAAGALGAAEAVRRLAAGRQRPGSPLTTIALVVITAAYVLIAVLALHTSLPDDLGLDLTPLEAEGVLVGILLAAGVNLAWLAFTEQDDPAPPAASPPAAG